MTEYEFACPDCDRRIEMDAGMRDATLSNGCPVCGAAVAAGDFTRT